MTEKKKTTSHRVWAYIPEDAWEEANLLSRRLSMSNTKVIQICAIAGLRVIHRAIFPEDALSPEFYAQVQKELDVLLSKKS